MSVGEGLLRGAVRLIGALLVFAVRLLIKLLVLLAIVVLAVLRHIYVALFTSSTRKKLEVVNAILFTLVGAFVFRFAILALGFRAVGMMGSGRGKGTHAKNAATFIGGLFGLSVDNLRKTFKKEEEP